MCSKPGSLGALLCATPLTPAPHTSATAALWCQGDTMYTLRTWILRSRQRCAVMYLPAWLLAPQLAQHPGHARAPEPGSGACGGVFLCRGYNASVYAVCTFHTPPSQQEVHSASACALTAPAALCYATLPGLLALHAQVLGALWGRRGNGAGLLGPHQHRLRGARGAGCQRGSPAGARRANEGRMGGSTRAG